MKNKQRQLRALIYGRCLMVTAGSITKTPENNHKNNKQRQPREFICGHGLRIAAVNWFYHCFSVLRYGSSRNTEAAPTNQRSGLPLFIVLWCFFGFFVTDPAAILRPRPQINARGCRCLLFLSLFSCFSWWIQP